MQPQMMLYVGAGVLFLLAILILPSIHVIGPTEVGLVMKRFSFNRLSNDNPIAFNGEAGYQAALLMAGWRFRFWIVYTVEKFPWVQVPAGEIGVVIAQVGSELPIGAKSADLQAGVRQLQPTWRASSATAGRRACSARCCLPARWCRCTRSRSWSSPSARCTACRCRGNSSCCAASAR